jgi:hypothetical protein
MYLDLDPERWPEGDGNIVNHPIFKRFFSSSSEQDTGSHFSEEYDIDSLPGVHDKYPLIDDAN